MDKIKEKIKNRIKSLEYRMNQLSAAKKNVKFYYGERIAKIYQDISDLEAQMIYYENHNETDIIDLHGATRYCVDNYLDIMIQEKLEYHKEVTIVTGKGTRILYHHVMKYLSNLGYKYKVKEIAFVVYN